MSPSKSASFITSLPLPTTKHSTLYSSISFFTLPYQGHGKAVDWWTLGILIYEMLASYPPFYDEDPMHTYKKIMEGVIRFPKHFSKPVIDLIQKLLHAKATKRLGSIMGGADLIKTHPWFQKHLNWDKLFAGKLKAPIVMKIKSDTDLSNFDAYPEDEDEKEDYTGTNGWCKEF
jgi:serine/threonine protein kinase